VAVEQFYFAALTQQIAVARSRKRRAERRTKRKEKTFINKLEKDKKWLLVASIGRKLPAPLIRGRAGAQQYQHSL
jgi:hypothetical protein